MHVCSGVDLINHVPFSIYAHRPDRRMAYFGNNSSDLRLWAKDDVVEPLFSLATHQHPFTMWQWGARSGTLLLFFFFQVPIHLSFFHSTLLHTTLCDLYVPPLSLSWSGNANEIYAAHAGCECDIGSRGGRGGGGLARRASRRHTHLLAAADLTSARRARRAGAEIELLDDDVIERAVNKTRTPLFPGMWMDRRNQ